MAERVVVAMSGGVDSSVTAALLVEAGYDVVGITMEIWRPPSLFDVAEENGCCGLSAVDDARAVARRLDIPHYVLNLRQPFQERIIAPFVESYRQGETPNPCIACNRYIKFDHLFEQAQALEADFLATGHYARTRRQDGEVRLCKAVDPGKDQSYVLYPIRREILPHLLFPLGDLSKTRVRELARERGLVVADKPDSQEICFVGGDYRSFLAREGASVPQARIVDEEGHPLGMGGPVTHYTRGQRRGTGVAAGVPLYVLEVRPDRAEVVLGPQERLLETEAWVRDWNWLVPPRTGEVSGSGRIRHGNRETPLILEVGGKGAPWRVRFQEPVWAPAPGQSLVVYEGSCLVGGGILSRPPA